jgi:hypothetical protein
MILGIEAWYNPFEAALLLRDAHPPTTNEPTHPPQLRHDQPDQPVPRTEGSSTIGSEPVLSQSNLGIEQLDGNWNHETEKG